MNETSPPFSGIGLLDEIARLQVERDALAEEARALKRKTSAADKRRAWVQAEIKRLEEQLTASRGNITVSDHAVIRYLERRYGFDFEDVRAEILTPAVRSAVNAGAVGVKVDGGTFKIKDRTITTYLRGDKEREA